VTNILTEDEFDKAAEQHGLNVFKFTAPSWCAPCRALAPHYKAAAEQVEGNFYDVDIDHADPVLSERFAVLSVPTVIAFRDGEFVGPVEGRTVLQLVNELG
jgi:thiol-disulfide isomerase/thioredoxin